MPSITLYALGAGAIFILVVLPILWRAFLTTVEAGTILIVSGIGGKMRIYKGPCRAWIMPLVSTTANLPAKAINIDLDISDQTADMDRQTGLPRPVKVRVLASAIVSVGDTNEMVQTAANKFFAKPQAEQTSTLTDLLTSTGRRAINLLHHDELFNAKVDASGQTTDLASSNINIVQQAENDDRLAIIIKSSCSRELQDLGLVFNSLNIKSVQSDVAEARRRQSAVEAKASADVVTADQERRAREAQLSAEQAISDKTRELEQRKAQNAAVIAEAEAAKQQALAKLREQELKATQIAQAIADAERVKVQAEASAQADAIKLRTVASAQAEAIRQVNAAIAEGGDAYLQLRQLELLPQLVPSIADALSNARMVTIAAGGEGGAADSSLGQISSVIQTVLAAQLINGSLKDPGDAPRTTPRPVPITRTDDSPKVAFEVPTVDVKTPTIVKRPPRIDGSGN